MKAREVYSLALSLMNEEGSGDYEARSVGLLNSLLAQAWSEGVLTAAFTAISSLEEELSSADAVLLCGSMPFGLAALLYLDEDAQRAASWWNIWQESLQKTKRLSPAEAESITDVYGTREGACFSRW